MLVSVLVTQNLSYVIQTNGVARDPQRTLCEGSEARFFNIAINLVSARDGFFRLGHSKCLLIPFLILECTFNFNHIGMYAQSSL